jgi:hypothetical protein
MNLLVDRVRCPVKVTTDLAGGFLLDQEFVKNLLVGFVERANHMRHRIQKFRQIQDIAGSRIDCKDFMKGLQLEQHPLSSLLQTTPNRRNE